MYGGYSQKTKIEQKSKPLRASRFIKLYRIVFTIFIFFGVFLLFSYASLFLIDTTKITLLHKDEKNFSVSDIEKATEIFLDEKRFGFVPQKHIVLFEKKRIQERLQDIFPAIKESRIEKRALRTLKVTVDSRIPAYLYCTSFDASNCSSLDETGFVFRDMHVVDGSQEPRISFSVATENNYFKTYLLAPDTFQKLHAMLSGFEGAGFTPKEVLIKKEGFVDVKTYNGTSSKKATTISFSLNDSSEVVLGNLSTLLDETALREVLAKDPEAVSYFILYTGNKLIYKLRDENKEENL